MNINEGKELLAVYLKFKPNWAFHTFFYPRPNQPILKEINSEYSLEGLMLKQKFQYLDHLMQRTDSLEKTLMLGNSEGRRRRGQQRIRWLDGITDSMDSMEFE